MAEASEALCCFLKTIHGMHFPLTILLDLLDFVLDNDSLVDHPLEILIVSVEKLELNLVIESIQECILFLLIGVDIIRCIP
jgi:hypothetical protein